MADQHGSESSLQALVERLVDELGSPFHQDGPGGVTFNNTVHQDHPHLGFDSA